VSKEDMLRMKKKENRLRRGFLFLFHVFEKTGKKTLRYPGVHGKEGEKMVDIYGVDVRLCKEVQMK
jgi:hypothetical protein